MVVLNNRVCFYYKLFFGGGGGGRKVDVRINGGSFKFLQAPIL
jgi:hypothetical protein